MVDNLERETVARREKQDVAAAQTRQSRSSTRSVIEHSGTAGRFFLVALAGLAIDITIAWSLIAFAGAADAVASVAGFAVATVANYLAHQFWTFRSGPRSASARRFLGFCLVVGVTLVVRLLVLDQLATVLPGSGIAAPIRLGLAAGASFVLSFLLSRFLVFRTAGQADA